MSEPASARSLAEAASRAFPNDSAERVAAATALVSEEIELRRHIERVAAQRWAWSAGDDFSPRPSSIAAVTQVPLIATGFHSFLAVAGSAQGTNSNIR